MQSDRTDTEAGRTLEVMLLDGYNEYIRYGYPKDPAVYRIRMNSYTLTHLEEHAAKTTTIPAVIKKAGKRWYIYGIKVVIDNRLDTGDIVFGPEQLSFRWDLKR